eukprot:g67.t1
MANVASHTAIQGDTSDTRKVTRALISVSNKENIVELGKFLAEFGVEILSTGGTAKKLRDNGVPVTSVKDYTGSREILNGRVKTLHPKIHGGILAVRGNKEHENDMEKDGIKPIDMVVVNLYPFQQTVAKGADFLTAMENVDIGGPTMLRASAKNNAAVVCVTSPDQYKQLMDVMSANNGATTYDLRKEFAASAFSHSATYDAAINEFFSKELNSTTNIVQNRTYKQESVLKYGCNPHQKPATLSSIGGKDMPFDVINGRPGYINLLDAANAWQLVFELKKSLNLPAAASFKHVSPAGAAVHVPLTDDEATAYEVVGKELTPLAIAYLRARNADPMSSFGDFAAVSEIVDEATALVLKTCVCDGIVAPGYDEKALEILKGKKKGAFIILKANVDYVPPVNEYRDHIPYPKYVFSLYLVVASIALKYTQSNSVGYAKNGQMVGVGAGQQSRVDCVKLAGRKVSVWALRQHPKVMALKFKPGVKKQERINARVRYIEGDITRVERNDWEAKFESVPEPLTQEEKTAFMNDLTGVSLSSDAFFPFRDNIDHASKYGVKYVTQPGGSRMDDAVTAACDEYGMVQCHHGVRLFHH